MFRHHLLLIGVFCATPASYWSVRVINTNSARQSVQSVANFPTVNTCETDSINIFSKSLAQAILKGQWHEILSDFQKLKLGSIFSKVPHCRDPL